MRAPKRWKISVGPLRVDLYTNDPEEDDNTFMVRLASEQKLAYELTQLVENWRQRKQAEMRGQRIAVLRSADGLEKILDSDPGHYEIVTPLAIPQHAGQRQLDEEIHIRTRRYTRTPYRDDQGRTLYTEVVSPC